MSGGKAEGLLARVHGLIPGLREEAGAADAEARFPAAGFAALREAGLLAAPVPAALGGYGLCEREHPRGLFCLLHRLGQGNMALGRVFEAHVNALELIWRFGTPGQMRDAALAARDGHLFALWVTDPPEGGLHLREETLAGGKWFCSAAGIATRALVTAETEAGPQMLAVPVGAAPVAGEGIALAGMRAALTGRVDLSGIDAPPGAFIGAPGDYLREPAFSTGAWRNYAVILGGLAALIEAMRGELLARNRADNPYQRMRFGQALAAHETGRLWLAEAACRSAAAAADADADADADAPAAGAPAYVNLARTATEAACNEAIRLVQRSLGLSAFRQGSPAERLCRDLDTYLRQPAPDEALAEAADYYLHHAPPPLEAP